jgi:hypothetical protein
MKGLLDQSYFSIQGKPPGYSYQNALAAIRKTGLDFWFGVVQEFLVSMSRRASCVTGSMRESTGTPM